MGIIPTNPESDGKQCMLKLTGEFEHTLDEKNRLFISNKLRSIIDCKTYGSDFFLTMGANGVLCLYPEKCFQQIALAGAPRTGAPDEAVAYERLIYALASRIELDRQGRLLIPEKMRKRANLGSQLTLIGCGDHIEIWNTEDWEQYMMENIGAFQSQVARARQQLLQDHKENEELKTK